MCGLQAVREILVGKGRSWTACRRSLSANSSTPPCACKENHVVSSLWTWSQKVSEEIAMAGEEPFLLLCGGGHTAVREERIDQPNHKVYLIIHRTCYM